MIGDCIQAMKEVDVNNKAKIIWSKMNYDTTVRVKTPIGMSDESLLMTVWLKEQLLLQW